MALPSSRRPAYAQKLLEEVRNEMQKKILKVKINIPQVIIESIGKWYSSLTPNAKKGLTPQRFKRRVMRLCYKVHFDYFHLPDNWITTLQETHKLVLHEKKRKVFEAPKKKFPAYVTDDLEDEITDDIFTNGSEQSFEDELRELMSTSKSEFTITSGTINKSSAGDSVRETRATFRKKNNNATLSQVMDDSECTYSTPKEEVLVDKKEVKKYLDLTSEPPPPQWLASQAKGVALPRVLRVYCEGDVNVIFYDYEPTPAEYPRGTIVKTIRDVGFQWWEGEIRTKLLQGKLNSPFADTDTYS